ncbi:7763_t:CDS:2, partial [Ambispora gerdemannii]
VGPRDLYVTYEMSSYKHVVFLPDYQSFNFKTKVFERRIAVDRTKFETIFDYVKACSDKVDKLVATAILYSNYTDALENKISAVGIDSLKKTLQEKFRTFKCEMYDHLVGRLLDMSLVGVLAGAMSTALVASTPAAAIMCPVAILGLSALRVSEMYASYKAKVAENPLGQFLAWIDDTEYYSGWSDGDIVPFTSYRFEQMSKRIRELEEGYDRINELTNIKILTENPQNQPSDENFLKAIGKIAETSKILKADPADFVEPMMDSFDPKEVEINNESQWIEPSEEEKNFKPDEEQAQAIDFFLNTNNEDGRILKTISIVPKLDLYLDGNHQHADPEYGATALQLKNALKPILQSHSGNIEVLANWTYVLGPPGTGKSVVMGAVATHAMLYVSATRRTKSEARFGMIAIDEFVLIEPMVLTGLLTLAAQHNLNVIACGDFKQICAINYCKGVPIKTRDYTEKLIECFPMNVELRRNYRCPRDQVNLLNHNMGYNMIAMSPIEKGIFFDQEEHFDAELITSYGKNRRRLTQEKYMDKKIVVANRKLTEREKREIIVNMVFTTHQSQGCTVKTHWYNADYADLRFLNAHPEYINVALSRNTEALYMNNTTKDVSTQLLDPNMHDKFTMRMAKPPELEELSTTNIISYYVNHIHIDKTLQQMQKSGYEKISFINNFEDNVTSFPKCNLKMNLKVRKLWEKKKENLRVYNGTPRVIEAFVDQEKIRLFNLVDDDEMLALYEYLDSLDKSKIGQITYANQLMLLREKFHAYCKNRVASKYEIYAQIAEKAGQGIIYCGKNFNTKFSPKIRAMMIRVQASLYDWCIIDMDLNEKQLQTMLLKLGFDDQ